MARFGRLFRWHLFSCLVISVLIVCLAGPAPAQRRWPSFNVCNNAQDFPRPIPLGVSGGSIDDSGSIYCCGGTLGCLVESGGKLYILSNNHILARTNQGVPGEPIIQPGLIDSSCRENDGNQVAELSAFVPIDFNGQANQVDAAIAEIDPMAVNDQGTINCLGEISSTYVPVNQLKTGIFGTAVQKSGRTSGLTSGRVAAVNVSIKVTYDEECGTGSQTALFINQIRIDGSNFSQGGDSGALIVTQGDRCPKPVGLLFAGGGSQSFANPIATVLAELRDLGYENPRIVGSECAPPVVESPAESPFFRRRWDRPGGSNWFDRWDRFDRFNRMGRLKARHEAAILAKKGVTGMGIGAAPDSGKPVVEIYVEKDTPRVRRRLPRRLNGTPVRIIKTGKIRAL